MELTVQERRVRKVLIQVAQGRLVVRKNKPGYISYKELWFSVASEPWGQNRSKEVVGWIAKIAGFELAQGRPPLNEIVVRTNRREPTEPWSSIKPYLEKRSNTKVPFRSHREAQEACWHYWGANDTTDAWGEGGGDDSQAEEGCKQDRTVTFRKRNAKLIAKRKKLDNHTCQACGFHLKLNDRHVIDCHHINPLGLVDAVTVTHIDHLICLCPTCHRIAHTRRHPLLPSEIAALLK